VFRDVLEEGGLNTRSRNSGQGQFSRFPAWFLKIEKLAPNSEGGKCKKPILRAALTVVERLNEITGCHEKINGSVA
jgi:hypothetical protein